MKRLGWLVQALTLAALTACTPQPARTTTPPSPMPPGFGEPLSSGPYTFFPDHPKHWNDIIARIRSVVEALPALRWQMCDVRSPVSQRTHTDHARALADLSKRLKSAGVMPWIETGPMSCRTEPRDVDMFYLMPTIE